MLDPNVLETLRKRPHLAMPAAEVEPLLPPPAPAPDPQPEEIGELYVRHRPLLLHVGCRKFRIPEPDAESLIQEVFLSFMTTTTKVENIAGVARRGDVQCQPPLLARAGTHRAVARGLRRAHAIRSSNGIADKMAMIITMQQALELPPAALPRNALPPLLRGPLRE